MQPVELSENIPERTPYSRYPRSSCSSVYPTYCTDTSIYEIGSTSFFPSPTQQTVNLLLVGIWCMEPENCCRSSRSPKSHRRQNFSFSPSLESDILFQDFYLNLAVTSSANPSKDCSFTIAF